MLDVFAKVCYERIIIILENVDILLVILFVSDVINFCYMLTYFRVVILLKCGKHVCVPIISVREAVWQVTDTIRQWTISF